MAKPKLQILPPPRQFDPNSVIPEPVKTTQPHISSFDSSEFDRINLIATHGDNSIYKVINRSTGQLYTLKVMPVQDDTVARRQVLREVQPMVNLRHENIVRYHGLVEEQGEIQALYEFVNGISLVGAHITDESRLSNICLQLLSAIAFVHDHRVALRNIKPSNILNGERDDRVKILDFASVSRIYSPDAIAYMSPERISSEELNVWGRLYDGFRDDIWGFGLTILEVYLGKYPLMVEKEGDWKCLVDAICDHSSMEVAESASEEFRDFIGCCLQRNPAMRWNAQELLQHPFVLRQIKPDARKCTTKRGDHSSRLRTYR